MRNNLRPSLFVAAVVLLVGALAVGGYTGFEYWSDQQTEHARAESVDAAQTTVTAMFTYDFNNVDTELPKSADNLTPDFRKDYLKLVNEVIAKGAKEKQLTVKASSQAAGVVSADRSHAVVLVYLNQITTGKESPQGAITPSRVRVTMDKQEGRWLASQVTPI